MMSGPIDSSGLPCGAVVLEGAPVVVHIDIDCFFAQVEELRDPTLCGRPMGVQQNMEVAAVNYEARAHGLFNRISVAEARRLCPELVLVRGDNGVNGMQRYRDASQGVLKVIFSMLGLETGGWEGARVEAASFDDFYVAFGEEEARQWLESRDGDAATWVDKAGGVNGREDTLSLLRVADMWATRTRRAVLERCGLRCSAGVGSSKILAMLGTKVNKPNGQYMVDRDEQGAFFARAQVSALRGAGVRGLSPECRTFIIRAVTTCDDKVTVAQARDWLDEGGEAELTAALGPDDARRSAGLLRSDGSSEDPVKPYALPQSISVELNARPADNDSAPCRDINEMSAKFDELAELLLGRARMDAGVYGVRSIDALVVKWKLFPGAREVRSRRCPWSEVVGTVGPASIDIHNIETNTVAQRAIMCFRQAVGTSPFAISRVGLGLAYIAALKRKRKAEGLPPERGSISQFFSRCHNDRRPSGATISRGLDDGRAIRNDDQSDAKSRRSGGGAEDAPPRVPDVNSDEADDCEVGQGGAVRDAFSQSMPRPAAPRAAPVVVSTGSEMESRNSSGHPTPKCPMCCMAIPGDNAAVNHHVDVCMGLLERATPALPKQGTGFQPRVLERKMTTFGAVEKLKRSQRP